MFKVGDRVYWNDGDNGCSGEYMITGISALANDILYILSDGSEVLDVEISKV